MCKSTSGRYIGKHAGLTGLNDASPKALPDTKLKSVLAVSMILVAMTGAFTQRESMAEDNQTSTTVNSHEFSANLALTTDYLFRGISQSAGHAAISGGFDYSHHSSGLYAGVWASTVDFSDDVSIEIDYYGGFSGDFDFGISWDAGAIYYAYPGNDNDDNYVEATTRLIFPLPGAMQPELGIFLAWSSNFFAGGGKSIFFNPYLNLSLPMDFSLSVAYGCQEVEKIGHYSLGSVGLSKTINIFSLNLSYNNNFNKSDFCAGDAACDDRVIFSVSSSL